MDQSPTQAELTILASTFDMLQEHVVITNETGTILYANKAAERITGFSHEEIIGRKPNQLWGGKMPKEFYESMWHYLNVEKKPFIGEVKNTRKDGTEYWQELHITPVLTETGAIRFFIAIEPDITDRKEREKYKEEFFSIARHQIMNPLTKNNIILDLLLTQKGMEKERQQILQLYKGNLDIMNLINDLVFLGRPKNQQHYNDTLDLLQEVEALIKKVKETNPSIMFSLNKEGTTFMLYTNEMLVEQIFYNVIANSAEYSPPDSGNVVVTIKDAGDIFIFTCEDNGIGIPADEQKDIFKKFYRASNAKDLKMNGTGLGMYIVKTICDELGWKVSFTSEIQKGTKFTIEIPKKQSE